MKYTSPLVVSTLASAAYAVSGCNFNKIVGTGFNAEFYKYPLWDMSANDAPDFFVGGYQNFGGQFASQTGVTDIQFDGGVDNVNEVQEGNIYGIDVSASNFAVALTGYFLPDESGDYTFEFSADDGFGVFIGSTGPCCENVNDTVTDVAQFSGTKGGNMTYQPGIYVTKQITVSMEANTYYPMKVVYVNELTQWKLYTTVTSPSGKKTSDFNNVYQVSDSDLSCPAVTTTVTVPTDSHFTTPGTYTPSDCDHVATCTVDVVTPGSSEVPSSTPASSSQVPSSTPASSTDYSHTTTTTTFLTNSEYSVPGTYTPSDCDDVATCTVDVVTPEGPSGSSEAPSSTSSGYEHTTTTTTFLTNSEYSVPGTYTPSDCDDVATCTVDVVTPEGPSSSSHTTTTTTFLTNSEYSVPGTYTPSDCDDVATCTVDVVTPEGPAETSGVPGVVTVTSKHETTVTVTHCSNSQCSTTAGIISVVTTTVSDMETTYTTICPLTESPSVTPGQPKSETAPGKPKPENASATPAQPKSETAPAQPPKSGETAPAQPKSENAPAQPPKSGKTAPATPAQPASETAPAQPKSGEQTPGAPAGKPSTVAGESTQPGAGTPQATGDVTKTSTVAGPSKAPGSPAIVESSSGAALPASIASFSEGSGSRPTFGVAGLAIAFAYFI